MATAIVNTSRPCRPGPSVTVPAKATWLVLLDAYLLGWAVIIAVTGLCFLVPGFGDALGQVVPVQLHHRITPAPAPSVSLAWSYWLTNARSTLWPLFPVAFGAKPSMFWRRAVHLAVAGSLAFNLLPIAVAVGIYRSEVVQYFPHVPLELTAITSGPVLWWLAQRRRLRRSDLFVLVLLLGTLLAVGAVLETWAVPHL